MASVQPINWKKKLGIATKGKAGVTAFCELLRIREATNEHKRDAACIAIWAAGHSQEMKLLQRSMEQEMVN